MYVAIGLGKVISPARAIVCARFWRHLPLRRRGLWVPAARALNAKKYTRRRVRADTYALKLQHTIQSSDY